MPPHDLDAERAVIGAILVSEAAVSVVGERLVAEDFYSETHRVLYGAMMRLYSRGDPIDRLTLSDELRNMGEFDRIGGQQYVFRLVESVPTAANATRYADIVRGKALLRAVIDAGSRIQQEAFAEPEDVTQALDAAEQLIYGVSNRQLKEHLAPVSELAPGTLEMIQRLYEAEGEITGVRSGFEDLDRLTTGFHKSDLVILAARPAMGKTALALNIISHVAGEKGLPVAIFSLEMSKEQLVQRLLAQTTRIPAQDLRNGNVRAEDWPKLVRGVAEVARAPIWIDDTAGITLMEMKAKVRRLASRLNAQANAQDTTDEARQNSIPLSLVVVDYLQLMVGQNARFENRQQEIADISRGLKVLARDLNVPVLAIAQLSRAVEQRHDKRPLLSDLRDCVTGDTLVSLADGRQVPIRDLEHESPRVLAISDSGHVVPALSDKVWRVGKRSVYEVRLRSGRAIRGTARHRLLTFNGWREIRGIAVGDRLAVPRHLPEPDNTTSWPDSRVALLAHLIGDGSYLSHQPMRYTTGSEECSALVERVAREEFGCEVRRYAGHRNWHQLLISGNGNRWHPAGVNAWLRKLGIFGQRSHEKRVPQEVFRLKNDQICLFLRHLWATDGTIGVRRTEKGSIAAHTHFSTASYGLAQDVSVLLSRISITPCITEHRQKGSIWYQVQIRDVAQLSAFLSLVGTFGERTPQAERVAECIEGVASNTNVDTLPKEVWTLVKKAMKERGVSHRKIQSLRDVAYNGSASFRFAPSRDTMLSYAEALEDESLRSLCQTDLFWDEVLSIVPVGEEEVYDLTVPGPASWIGNGIVSHNSGAIEQDADMVMFLYRDEYYNPDSDDKGIAEVVVGKHRNGPTGKVQLTWMEKYTKFGSLARHV